MGGRGASTNYGRRNTNGEQGTSTFYDLSDRYRGMPIHDFENKIRDRKNEYIGLADENGNIIIAGTSYKKGSVAIPQGHPDFAKSKILTHNHPYSKDRPIGATFSEADIINHATLSNVISETRAVSGGKGENTYIIKPTSKGKTNPLGLYKYATEVHSNKTMDKVFNEAVKTAETKFAKQGKTLSVAQKNQIGLGSLKRVWKGKTEKFGYDYVEVKKHRW